MQQTIATSFTLKGAGIHTGAFGRVTAHPAETDAGRVFRVGGIVIPARADFVVDTARCTTLGAEGVRISTVEHLLSALHGFCIDNALIEVEGPEIPILDGSALPFAEAIQQAGIVAQDKSPRIIVSGEIEFTEGRTQYRAAPSATEGVALNVAVDFDNWPEGRAEANGVFAQRYEPEYCRAVAAARTFAFQEEVEQLMAAGLAKGGSLDNALIITPPDGFSTPLRLPQEWAVHKMLDLIGDLALVDARIQAAIFAARPGHRANVRLALELLKQSKIQSNHSALTPALSQVWEREQNAPISPLLPSLGEGIGGRERNGYNPKSKMEENAFE